MEATKVWETEGERERTDQKVVNGSNKSVGNRGRERKNRSEGSKWKQQNNVFCELEEMFILC